MFKNNFREVIDIGLIIRLTHLLNSITIAALLFSIVACNNFGTLSDNTAPIFLSEPSIELDPNLNTPLAALLTLTTDIRLQTSDL